MNRKQLILLLLVLAVIGSAGIVLLRQHRDAWSQHEARMGDKVLPDFKPNDIAAIHIHGAGDLTVTRTNEGWVVPARQNYPANFGQISDLLIQLKDLKVVQAEVVGAADLGRVNLDPPGKGRESGTLVEFSDASGKVVQAMLLGKKHMRQGESAHAQFVGSEPDGRYLLLPNDPQDVLLVSNTLAALESRPEAWINRDFIKLERIKSIEMVSTNPVNSWKVSRDAESSPWALADAKPGEELDASKVSIIGNMLAAPRFVDIVPPTPPSQLGLDYPKVVTIQTFDGFTYVLKVGGKASDDSYFMTVTVTGNLPAQRTPGKDEKPEDTAKLDGDFTANAKKLQAKLKQEKSLAPWVYVVNNWIFDPALKDRPQLLQGYKEEQHVVNSEPVAAPAPAKQVGLPGDPTWKPRVIK